MFLFFSEKVRNKSRNMSDDGSDGGEVYEVEKILEKRMKKGKAEYLIKWKGSKTRNGEVYILCDLRL